MLPSACPRRKDVIDLSQAMGEERAETGMTA
jgi:hypothetical protein